MDNPADILNAAIDELIKQRYELPAFSTLDRLAGRVRALVYGRICRAVQRRMAAEVQHGLETLFEVQLPSHRSAFSQLKLVPQSPTLSHLKAWQDRLTWLMKLGSMETLLKDIPPAIVKHFAAEARALDASELQDYTPAKRLTLVACILGSGIALLDGTVVNVALPTIQRELGGGLAAQQWVANGYLLTLGSLILLGGSLGDVFGGGAFRRAMPACWFPEMTFRAAAVVPPIVVSLIA